jgi:hypothetical protein
MKLKRWAPALAHKEKCYEGLVELHGPTSSELSSVLTDLAVCGMRGTPYVCVFLCPRWGSLTRIRRWGGGGSATPHPVAWVVELLNDR